MGIFLQIEENLLFCSQIEQNLLNMGIFLQIEENTFEYMNLFKKDLVGPYNSSSYKPYT